MLPGLYFHLVYIMGYSAFICTTLLIFSVFSCGSSGKKGTKNEAGSNKAQTFSSRQDTLPDMPPPIDPAPAPGTVRLRGKIIKVHTTEKEYLTIYEVKVLKILGIGASATPIVSLDTLKIESSQDSAAVKADTEVVCIIRQKHLQASQQDSVAAWQLLRWERN